MKQLFLFSCDCLRQSQANYDTLGQVVFICPKPSALLADGRRSDIGDCRREVKTSLKPDSHMSPTIGELLSVTVDPENSQKILCIDSCEQSSSPTIATYENQA